ncbi:MAG TPA: hypothetical protein VGA53_00055 [Candidatus Paceibacterota bacterium]
MYFIELVSSYLPSVVAAVVVILVGFLVALKIYLIPCAILLLLFWIISKFTSDNSLVNRKSKILGLRVRGKYWISFLVPLPVFAYIFFLYVVQALALLAR